MDQFKQLTEMLARATDEAGALAVDDAVYRIRKVRQVAHDRQVAELLKYVADIKERFDTEDEKWSALENAAMDKRMEFADRKAA